MATRKQAPLYLQTRLALFRKDLICVVANTIREGVELVTARTGVTFNGLTEADYQASGLCINRSNGSAVLLFQYGKLSSALICHEATHVTNAMLDKVGMVWTWQGDEVYAYHNELVFRTVAELLEANKVRVPLFIP